MLVPGLTPVTTPVLDIVATSVFDDVQGLTAAGVPDPVSAVVEPTQTLRLPVMVGNGFTLTVTDDWALQPVEGEVTVTV